MDTREEGSDVVLTPKKKRAPRDPEGRKRAIVEAAADIIFREGTKKVTNRSVAELAGVPLGSTTQYFKSIEELRAAGLAEVAKRVQCEYDKVFATTKRGVVDVSVFAESINDYLSNKDLVRADAALHVAALEDPEFDAVARSAFESFLEKCETLMGRRKALMLFALVEGVVLNSLFADVSYDRDTVQKTIGLIMQCEEF